MKEFIKKDIVRNPTGAKPSNNQFEVTEEVELLTFLLAKMPNKSRHNVKALLRDKP